MLIREDLLVLAGGDRTRVQIEVSTGRGADIHPSATATAVRLGACLVSETLPPLVRLTLIRLPSISRDEHVYVGDATPWNHPAVTGAIRRSTYDTTRSPSSRSSTSMILDEFAAARLAIRYSAISQLHPIAICRPFG